jgi:lipopolysaccharide/colanic/teichoic acid biosynthesis glycosyltransferase
MTVPAPLTTLIREPEEGLSRAGAWSHGYFRWKASLDIALAILFLILATPLVLLAALLVRLTSRGPAFYCQTRLGKEGEPFTLFKIRTMYDDSERDCGAVWSWPGDPRVTPVGWILRATHIDELPQLINIIRGEMSLIGPRPERPEIVSQLERIFPEYRDRLSLRPGITGLAQVQLPPDTEIAMVGRKLSYDLYYASNLSLHLDVRILLGTAMKLVGAPFPLIRLLLNFPICGGERDFDSLEKVCRRVALESHS